MKIKLSKWLLAVSIVITSICFSTMAEARYCRWQPGYWHNGHHYAGRRVCWDGGYRHGYRYGCRWIGGHYRNGYWIRGHKVCR